MTKKYICQNGGNIRIVDLDEINKNFRVYDIVYETIHSIDFKEGKLVMDFTPYISYFMDTDAMLFVIGDNQYIFIGSEILKFSTPKNITKFITLIWGSDVHFSYAIAGEWVYLFTFKVIVPFIPEYKDNPYKFYYNLIVNTYEKCTHHHDEDGEEHYTLTSTDTFLVDLYKEKYGFEHEVLDRNVMCKN